MSQEEFELFKKMELGFIKKVQERIIFYQQKANTPDINLRKKESFLKNATNYANTLRYHQKKLKLAHPENPEEIAEKRRIGTTYSKIIKDTIPEDDPVFFHGVKDLTYLEDILSSGHLGYLDDEQTVSFTSPGTLDTTTKDGISTTINGFCGLEHEGTNKFIPAGCLFVITPKDEQEKAFAKEKPDCEHAIETVDFKNNPERIVAMGASTGAVAGANLSGNFLYQKA